MEKQLINSKYHIQKLKNNYSKRYRKTHRIYIFNITKIYEENYNISIVIKQSYVVNDWNINIINYRQRYIISYYEWNY